MGHRRQLLADLNVCLESPHMQKDSASVAAEKYIEEIDRVSNILTTLQREFPDILRISQAPKPADNKPVED